MTTLELKLDLGFTKKGIETTKFSATTKSLFDRSEAKLQNPKAKNSKINTQEL